MLDGLGCPSVEASTKPGQGQEGIEKAADTTSPGSRALRTLLTTARSRARAPMTLFAFLLPCVESDFTIPPIAKEEKMALDGRHRDKDGRISEKHGNTLIGTLRQEYGQDVAPGLKDSDTLAKWRSQEGGKSLSQLLKSPTKG